MRDLNRANAELNNSDSSILNKIKSPDFRTQNESYDGYLVPKLGEDEENSAGSVMSRKNIHRLSIVAPPVESGNSTPTYLTMHSPKDFDDQNDYTHMSRTTTPATAKPTNMHRSYSQTPTIPEESQIFQFPPFSRSIIPEE